MIQLTESEYHSLRSQIVTLKNEENKRGKHSKYLPYAFTEQGVAMLSSVLRSPNAVKVNIAIMRAFVLLRQHLHDYQDLKTQIELLEADMNLKFKDIHDVLNHLLSKPAQRKHTGCKEFD